MDHCIEDKWTPNVQRLMLSRRCTRMFKILPINYKLKELGATRAAPYNVHIGISIDEAQRLGSGAWVNKPQIPT